MDQVYHPCVRGMIRQVGREAVLGVQQKIFVNESTFLIRIDGNGNNVRFHQIIKEMGTEGGLRCGTVRVKGNFTQDQRLVDIFISHPDAQVDVVTPPSARTEKGVPFFPPEIG